MAKLELPVRAFLESFCRRAFPDRDWSRGSGINDLVLKPFAIMTQPLRHEIDSAKIAASITNFQFMRRSDLDGIAANWGKFRQSGSRSIGNVRIHFSTAADYHFSYLEFVSKDGASFVLTAPVSITAQDLLAARQADDTYTFDVEVQSVGVGNRYALPAGSIVSVRNAPAEVVSVENVEDFSVTAPDESNYDVANSMFKNIGLRNLVSPASIRAPLLDNFAGIVDIFIAGADHPKMVRDLITTQVNGRDIIHHVGGMTDIWLNTSSVVQRQVVFSYLPQSGKLRLVSADQAAENELLCSFSRAFLDIDGLFAAQDFPSVSLDESSVVFFNQAGLLYETSVLGAAVNSRNQLIATDILRGDSMLVMPTPNNYGMGPKQSTLLFDPLGLNFGNTLLSVGDRLQYDSAFRKLTRLSGRAIEVSPAPVDGGHFDWDDLNGTLIINPNNYTDGDIRKDTFIQYANDGTIANLNDRCVITTGEAAGAYHILSVDTTGIGVGNLVSDGQIVYVSDASEYGIDDGTVYHYQGPSGSAPKIPDNFGPNGWIYLNGDSFPAVDFTDGNWFQVFKVIRTATTVTIVVYGNPGGGTIPTRLFSGLRGEVLDGTRVYIEGADVAQFDRSTRQIFGTEDPTSITDVGHTLYINQTVGDVDAGVQNFSALGIGRIATPGNLILFEGVEILDSDVSRTGGDGTKFSVMVSTITDDDTITFQPPLTFPIPEGTRFAVMRNHVSVGTLVVASADVGSKTIQVDDWPMGLGDGLGYILKHNDERYVVQLSTAGSTRTLKFKAPRDSVTVVFGASGYLSVSPDDVGSTVVQQDESGTAIGTLISYDNTTRTWVICPNDPDVDEFSVSTTSPISIEGSQGIGYPTGVTDTGNIGYFDPDSGDVGKLVRQGSYVGVLQSYDSDTYSWVVKPLSESDLFDIVDDSVLTFVDYGGGVPQTSVGRGTMREPSSSPIFSAGPVTLTLDVAPDISIVADEEMEVYPRFPITGGFFTGTSFKVLEDDAISFDPFYSTEQDDQLLVLLGSNYDKYNVDSAADKYAVAVQNSDDNDFVRVANAPPAQPLVFSGTIAANTFMLSVPGSNMGFWAQHGRVLILSTGGKDYFLAIDGPVSQDALSLIDPIPVSLYSDQIVTWEIVEAFHLPFFTVDPANLKNYRLFQTPAVGEVVASGSTGAYTTDTPSQFADDSADFASVFGCADFSVGDYLLYIDSGADASITPIDITGMTDLHRLVVSPDFTTSAGPVDYHIVRRNIASDREFWVDGTISSDGQTVTLDVDESWDFLRNNTYAERCFVVGSHPAETYTDGAANWQAPLMIGGFDVESKVLSPDFSTRGITPNSIAGLSGFTTHYRSKRCRVMVRLVDRAALHVANGTAVDTFNYYLRDFFALPVIRVQSVQLLDAQSLQPERDLKYALTVNDAGLRYSDIENNSLTIDSTELSDAAGKPIRVNYTADLSIGPVNAYLKEPDTRVMNANQLAKRMETISVDLSISVRSESTEAELAQQVALFINTARSSEPLSKDRLIKYLYQQNLISYIDVSAIVMSGEYWQQDGTLTDYTDVNELFGSETSCYLSGTILVTKLAERVSS